MEKASWYAQNKELSKAQTTAYRKANTDAVNAWRRERYAAKSALILEQNKGWRERNPEYEAERYAADVEGQKKRVAEYRAANPQKQAEYGRKFYAENTEKRKANTARWVAENPDKAKRQVQRRRAAKKAAAGSYTVDEWRALVERFGGYCLCCKQHFGIRKLTADHVQPLSQQGSDYIENIQPLCYSCNSSKGNRHATDYRLQWITAS